MRRAYTGSIYRRCYSTTKTHPPIIHIENGSFYRNHPNASKSTHNPVLFPSLDLSIPSFSTTNEHWAIVGPSSAGKTTLLQLLRNKHISIPASARTYPYLTEEGRTPERAIKQVGFDGEQGLYSQAPKGAYLSARYESRREVDDWSVRDYLRGDTELNPSKPIGENSAGDAHLERVISDLRLVELVDMPVSNLSNGQTRRARIAKALLAKPEVLLLDEPFLGLDPPTLLTLSPLLKRLADARSPRLVLALRPQDPIPEWITHLIWLKGNCNVKWQGKKDEVLKELRDYMESVQKGTAKDAGMGNLHPAEIGRELTVTGIREAITPTQKSDEDLRVRQSRDGYLLRDDGIPTIGEPVVEMEGAKVAYGDKVVLGNWKHKTISSEDTQEGLWWTVKRGERWGIFGPNGSGKTTLLSLICSDHPQTYSLPIRLFGRSRLPEPGQAGISIFDIQSRIGHSSPEIHNHIPRSLTLRQVLENAWADTFNGVPRLGKHASWRISTCLNWFRPDLEPGYQETETSVGMLFDDTISAPSKNAARKLGPRMQNQPQKWPKWADDVIFGQMPFSAQKVALFLRAIIKHPDLVILDEAFSGMDDAVRDRCLLFLAHGERKCISYLKVQGDESTTSSNAGPRIIDLERPHDVFGSPDNVGMQGLKERQALICISHVREEIPGSVREWICLPEANTGEPARLGRLSGPLDGDEKRWNEIWGME